MCISNNSNLEKVKNLSVVQDGSVLSFHHLIVELSHFLGKMVETIRSAENGLRLNNRVKSFD